LVFLALIIYSISTLNLVKILEKMFTCHVLSEDGKCRMGCKFCVSELFQKWYKTNTFSLSEGFDVHVIVQHDKFFIINQPDAPISQIYFGMKLCVFRTVPLSIIRSFSLYTQQWYMSYRFVDSLRAGSG
jgi:hypothetical protein